MNSFSFFVVLLLLLVGVTNFLLLEAAETHYYDFVVSACMLDNQLPSFFVS